MVIELFRARGGRSWPEKKPFEPDREPIGGLRREAAKTDYYLC